MIPITLTLLVFALMVAAGLLSKHRACIWEDDS